MAPKKEAKPSGGRSGSSRKGAGSKGAASAARASSSGAATKRKEAGVKAAQPDAERPSKKAKDSMAGAPGAPPPGPGYLLTAEQENQADMLIRQAKSALQFHDPRTTVLKLQEALALLTQALIQ